MTLRVARLVRLLRRYGWSACAEHAGEYTQEELRLAIEIADRVDRVLDEPSRKPARRR